MSAWDRYFAPGDLRARRRLEEGHLADNTEQPAPPTIQQTHLDAAHRQRRQDGLLYGGIVFTYFSLLITRRAHARKRVPYPKMFTTSNAPLPAANRSLDGLEALGLATLNVFSIAMAAVGGAMTYFDVADVEDMRDKIRKGVGFDVYGGDAEADKEMETWAAEMLSLKDRPWNINEGITEKLKEMEQKEKDKKRRVAKAETQPQPASSWFAGLSGWSKNTFDPNTSTNAYVNGSRRYEYRLGNPFCLRCGQPGHSSTECGYAALSPGEQDYLRKMVENQRRQAKSER